jgi:hypothetical protein
MIETADVATLRELHIIMLRFIHNLTPSINEKMRKNLDLNCQKPTIMLLARTYFDYLDKAGVTSCLDELTLSFNFNFDVMGQLLKSYERPMIGKFIQN